MRLVENDAGQYTEQVMVALSNQRSSRPTTGRLPPRSVASTLRVRVHRRVARVRTSHHTDEPAPAASAARRMSSFHVKHDAFEGPHHLAERCGAMVLRKWGHRCPEAIPSMRIALFHVKPRA